MHSAPSVAIGGRSSSAVSSPSKGPAMPRKIEIKIFLDESEKNIVIADKYVMYLFGQFDKSYS